MKKKFILALTLIIMVFAISDGKAIKADSDPAFLITENYIIIDHVKYDLVDNKISYKGLDFELIDAALVAYDEDEAANIFVLPVEQNRIKDKEKINELNALVGDSNITTRSIPTSTVNPPYTRVIPEGYKL